MSEHSEPNESDEAREPREPHITDKRKIDPKTGEARGVDETLADPDATAESDAPADPDATGAPAASAEPDADATAADATDFDEADLALLAEAERDLVAEYRDRAARAEAELVNFRTRVERDRQANREAVIAEVIRSLLPAIDDLDRAETHGDLADGSPLAIVAQKLRGGFDRYGLKKIGEAGEVFDPKLHEALVQLPSPDVEVLTVADVIEPGYVLGERVIRAAKVAVHAPQG